MPVDLDNSSTVSGEASVSSTGNQQNPLPKSAAKKKRNLPGMPGNIKIQSLTQITIFFFNSFADSFFVQIQTRKW